MRVVFNGRHRTKTGKAPKKPVHWFGTITVSGATGDAMACSWSSDKGQPLLLQQAIQAILLALTDAQTAFALEYQAQPDRVTFDMQSR
ncbi:hypothetical protein [Pseudomonas atacamensis]|uniref:hypothetical protein n=1 Tax=Pseudomonas atacamensis TaxID=2565368 RepID=UPI0019D12F75|nr:hypothetical protein [Pseudomonas atacamensis]QSL90461.1 hypothetical protein JWU58_26855 [Pseudomonas atacamensis]